MYWNVVALRRYKAQFVPQLPGLYVVAATERTLGLPTTLRPLYVGKSRNLRQRFVQHTDLARQHNSALGRWLFTHSLEFWHASADEDKIDVIERTLIRALRPLTNRIRYENGYEHRDNRAGG